MWRRRRYWAIALVPVLFVSTLVALHYAHASHPFGEVVDGHARFEVLSPTLIRMEYAADGNFEDRPTFNVVHRAMAPTSSYTVATENGERVIRTGKLTLRYRLNSGPFTEQNLRVDLTAGAQPATAHPAWRLPGSCEFGTTCEAEIQVLGGGAKLAKDQGDYTGQGFVDTMVTPGAMIAWNQRGIRAAGAYQVMFRYASAPTSGAAQSAVVNAGGVDIPVKLARTGDWNTWATASVPVKLPAGQTPVTIKCVTANRCEFNVDSVAVTRAGGAFPPAPDPGHDAANLGGWQRSLDLVNGPVPLFDGLLSRDGWYLLNDSGTAVTKADGGLERRGDRRGYQDGYFFGYGHDYRQGLRDLHDLTGPAVMLPRWAFGNWFSRYFPYSDADYRTTVLPAFRENKVPLDVLVVDTDFKSPNNWNGWAWNPAYFPDPKGFLDWAREQGLVVSLNIHPSIHVDDPRYAEVKSKLGYDLPTTSCLFGPCHVFDFSRPDQLAAYFDLHKPFEEQGPILWWLDSCCDASFASADGISADAFIDAQYAARTEAQGRRGFSWNRSGSGFTVYGHTAVYPAGPWSDHRYDIDTTMDTVSTWDMLAFASYYTVRRASIGMPYESHDIGAHNYYQDGNHLPPDLYARWIQLGAFQPILRLHSNHGYRAPWDYPDPAKASATAFMQLREALVPYTYTLGRQAYDTGLPMARGMYLNYPEYDDAYKYGTQYLFGDDLLVAPVTTPGTENVPTQVWFPPGTWTDLFTGQSYTGPAVRTITTDLSTMPVFQRGGGILPTRTDYVDHAGAKPLDQVTLDVATGATGSFRLYEDAGEGLAYRTGEFAWTSLSVEPAGTLTIAAREGTFPGAVGERSWLVQYHDVDRAPAAVTVDGHRLPAQDWSYDGDTRTITVHAGKLPTNAGHTIAYTATG